MASVTALVIGSGSLYRGNFGSLQSVLWSVWMLGKRDSHILVRRFCHWGLRSLHDYLGSSPTQRTEYATILMSFPLHSNTYTHHEQNHM